MVNRTSRAFAVALALTAISMPASAQQLTSDGYAFIEAVKKRDGNKATELLSQPSTTVVNARDRSSGDGALHIVARARDLTWLDFLSRRGARVDMQNKEQNTPLLLAAQIGWVEGAQFLIRKRANVHLANNRGETPLISAVIRRDMPMVRLLLTAGADPKRSDNTGYSALDYARRDTRAGAILRLLEVPPPAARAVAGPKP